MWWPVDLTYQYIKKQLYFQTVKDSLTQMHIRILILNASNGAQNNLFQFLGECHTDCSDLFPTLTMIGISGQNHGDMVPKTHYAFFLFLSSFLDMIGDI